MSITGVDKDFDHRTLTVTSDFDAPVERVWELWADPRLLERWWGPPNFPATFERHELVPGGRAAYYMTGPDGERYHGWWKVTAVGAPNTLEFTDGFGFEEGASGDDMPETNTRVRLSAHEGGTRMELVSSFETHEEMEQLEKMGMTEGLTLAIGQMDALLAS